MTSSLQTPTSPEGRGSAGVRRRRHPAMSATATLTNCYVPLPVSASSSKTESSSSQRPSFDPLHRRTDDSSGGGDDGSGESTGKATNGGGGRRGPRTLRRIHLKTSILSESTGSSLVEWGATKVMCSVRGPRPLAHSSVAPSSAVSGAGGDGVHLFCEARYLPHVGVRISTAAGSSSKSLDARVPPGGARLPRDVPDASSSGASLLLGAAVPEETFLSNRLREALAPAVMAMSVEGDEGGEGWSKYGVDVFVSILQADGSVFAAAVAAASLALVDAGIPMRDMVCGSTAAVVATAEGGESNGNSDAGGKKWCAIADPTEDEILLRSSSMLTIAMMPNLKEVTSWDQTGKMAFDAHGEAMELARDGCTTMHKFLRNSLMEE